MWGCHRGMIGPSRDPRAVLHEGGEARMGPWDPRPHWRRMLSRDKSQLPQ